MKEKSQPEATDASLRQLMYIGPTIITPLLLTHRGVFTGRPAAVNNLDKELGTALGACFVPISEAAAALRELEGAREAGQAIKNYKAAERVIRSLK